MFADIFAPAKSMPPLIRAFTALFFSALAH
jgi:hypothetical protein